MKYKISTDRAIIEHIEKHQVGEAMLHACVGNGVLSEVAGFVTSCDKQRRIVTLQLRGGAKNSYSFDHISVPDTDE
jgi:hypothetical protein